MSTKTRTRLYFVGSVAFRRITLGQYRGYELTPCRWACTVCGAKSYGTPERPWSDDTACARNGHAPCALCGKQLPRLNCGCPREHNWNSCPAKTEADRVQPQHAHKGHLHRAESTA